MKPLAPDYIYMKSIIVTMFVVIGGWLGWWLGGLANLMLAVILSVVGSGAGLYYGKKLVTF